MLVSPSLGSCRELSHDSPCHTDDKHHDPEREQSNACFSSRGANVSPSPKNSACREEQKDFSHPNDYQRIIHSFSHDQREPSPFSERPSAAFQKYVWTVLLGARILSPER